MKGLCAGGRNSAVLIGAALCLVIATNGSTFAQRGRMAAAERNVEKLNRQGDQYNRDKLSRELKEGTSKPGDQKHAQLVAAQIKHDFEGLQAGYNRIVLAMGAKQGFTHETVLAAVADIRKCSVRLRDNLALPRSKDEEEKEARREAAHEQAEDPLVSLQKRIYSFVTNPLFEAPSVLDVERAQKASRDLDRIIALSENIKKGGDHAKKH